MEGRLHFGNSKLKAQDKLQSSSLRARRNLERPRLAAWGLELPPGGHTRDGFDKPVCAKHAPGEGCSLPMNLAPTNPPLTPPRRGTSQPVFLPSWEGLGVGSRAKCAHKIRGILSPRVSVRGNDGSTATTRGLIPAASPFGAHPGYGSGGAERIHRRRVRC